MVAQNKWEDYAYLIGFIVNVPLANWVIAMLVSYAFRTGRALSLLEGADCPPASYL
jgi:hypothetical protein